MKETAQERMSMNYGGRKGVLMVEGIKKYFNRESAAHEM
jgi:hypothetical protein